MPSRDQYGKTDLYLNQKQLMSIQNHYLRCTCVTDGYEDQGQNELDIFPPLYMHLGIDINCKVIEYNNLRYVIFCFGKNACIDLRW